MESVLSMWIIYDHPLDFPQYFVARRWEAHPGRPMPTDDLMMAEDLGDLRDALPEGLYPLARDEMDDPTIVEVWL